MFNASRYKRSQGRVARQLTFAAIAVAVAVGAWKLNSVAVTDVGKYVVPLVVLAAGLWAGFRIVNMPKFADFLISVEAEMNKVSWPSRAESWRASLVVIVVIFFLAGLLFAYDFVLDLALNFIFGL
ncbi:MAG: preprotein translocase subunit SecE [Planctomycetales bacterium]|nr:preprotein translocase subunit SecE [Planctomycetales bacterium]